MCVPKQSRDSLTFADAFPEKRCIIPATGFYEWKPVGGKKVPHHFHLRTGGVMGFAGLCSMWKVEGESPNTAPYGEVSSRSVTRRSRNPRPRMRPDASPCRLHPLATGVGRAENQVLHVLPLDYESLEAQLLICLPRSDRGLEVQDLRPTVLARVVEPVLQHRAARLGDARVRDGRGGGNH